MLAGRSRNIVAALIKPRLAPSRLTHQEGSTRAEAVACRHPATADRVPGAACRASLMDDAARQSVPDRVRNRASGDVDALVPGTPEAVEAIIKSTHRGQSLAIVCTVDIQRAPVEPFARFAGGPIC
jgi:acylphosphatase